MKPNLNACRSHLMTLSGLALALYASFWVQIHSGFTKIMGDPYDGVIENTLVSHWFWVLGLQRPWNEVGYFYPYADTLGYNDGYFLFGVMAALFRPFGLNPFGAAEAAHMLLKAIGFLGYLQLSEKVSNDRLASIVGAVLFSICINTTNHGHAQLLLVGLCPSLWFLSQAAVNCFEKREGFADMAIWSLLLGTMLVTGFYITYFACLFLGTLLTFWLMVNPREGFVLLRAGKSRILPFSILLMAAVIPFLCVYIPKLHETGGHNPAAVFAYLLKVQEVVNDNQNLLWGDRIHTFFSNSGILHRDGEYSLGFPPLFLIAFGVSGFFCIRDGFRSPNPTARFFFLVTLNAVFWLLACIDWNGWSFWHLIYQSIPGAKGLRVVSRFYIFLALPMALVISQGLSMILRQTSRGRIRRAAFYLVSLLLIAEEINPHPYVGLSTIEPLKLLNDLKSPPATCRSFYVINPTGFRSENVALDDVLRTNVQAMMISSFLNLPTVVGISSFNPPDWNFREGPPETFEQRVMAYAFQHQVLEKMCRLDMANNQWSLVGYEQNATMTHGIADLAHPSDSFLIAGFNASENWGAWSSENEPRILFKQRLPNPLTVILSGLRGFGPMSQESLEVSCGTESHRLSLDSEPHQVVVTFNGADCTHTLHFRGAYTTKPTDIPSLNSTDNRDIGFGLSKIEIGKGAGPYSTSQNHSRYEEKNKTTPKNDIPPGERAPDPGIPVSTPPHWQVSRHWNPWILYRYGVLHSAESFWNPNLSIPPRFYCRGGLCDLAL